jgi:hypothetical protein
LLAACQPALAASDRIAAIPTEGRFTHGTLDSLLRQVVRDELVDYATLKQQRAMLDRYLGQIAGVRPDQLPTRADSLAFFINAYNAIVLDLVAQRYPDLQSVMEGAEGESPAFFENKAQVAGHYLSLKKLEYGILRARFGEPRVHFAINCASVSCPPLRERVFRGKGLEEQLDEVTRRFINDPSRNRYDPEAGVLYLSQVFKWFPMDFERVSGSVEEFFFAYLVGFGPGRDVPEVKILFMPYDWRLNAWTP